MANLAPKIQGLPLFKRQFKHTKCSKCDVYVYVDEQLSTELSFWTICPKCHTRERSFFSRIPLSA